MTVINDLATRRVSTGPMALSKFSSFTYNIYNYYYTYNGTARSVGDDNDDDGYNILLSSREI